MTQNQNKKITLAGHIGNIFFVVVLIALFLLKYPQIKENFKMQGEAINNNFSFVEVRTNQNILFPASKKQIVVFWATWCGPCKIELSRLQNLVDKKKLLPDQLLAISVDENKTALNDFLNSVSYSFLVVHDSGQLSQKFNVMGTPTSILINEKNQIEWRTTGVSPTLELRVLNFF